MNRGTLNAQRSNLPLPVGEGRGEGTKCKQTMAGSLPPPTPLPLGEAGVRVRRMGEDGGEGAQRVAENLEA
jgi:hypothetical protein